MRRVPGGHDGSALPAWASARLPPGGRRLISEDEWRHFLTEREPLHQWGAAYLLDEGGDGCVRVYLRDDGAQARHTCVRLDARRSALARAGAEAVEVAARRAADVITAGQQRPSHTPAELEAEAQASAAFVQAAEALYRDLLRP